MTGRFSEAARAARLRRANAARTEDVDVEREQEPPEGWDGPETAAELAEAQYGPEARDW